MNKQWLLNCGSVNHTERFPVAVVMVVLCYPQIPNEYIITASLRFDNNEKSKSIMLHD